MVVVIPKVGKDLSLPESYRPVSLLNQNYKILITIMATRLNQIIGSYISRDQAGFIKGRTMRDRVRQVLNIIDWAKYTKEPTLLYFLDTNKAFDTVEWPF